MPSLRKVLVGDMIQHHGINSQDNLGVTLRETKKRREFQQR